MQAFFLRRAIKQSCEGQGYRVNFSKGIHVGCGMIDGEAICEPYYIAIELRSDGDYVSRGLGQLLEALAHGYNQASSKTVLPFNVKCTGFMSIL